MSTWRPIQTAPTDTPVLVIGETWEEQIPMIGILDSGQWVEFDGGGYVEPQPTHWHPLPDPLTGAEIQAARDMAAEAEQTLTRG